MMKNIKKYLSIMLVCVTVFSFSSCGDFLNSNVDDQQDFSSELNKPIRPSAGNTGNGETSIVGNWYDDENFEPVIRFTVTADTHVGTGTTDTYKWTQELFADVFQHSYSYSESQEYDTIDAFVDVGDFVDHGLPGEYENFIRVCNDNLREETLFIPVMAGHELINGTSHDFTTNLRTDTGIHEVINGYHLIAISNNNNTSPCKGFEWIEEQVRMAYEDDPTKPIFVFQHHPINDTILSSNDNLYSEQYNAIYEEYSNIILFTAHTHPRGSEPANILQKDYTMLGVASIAYNEYSPNFENRPVMQGLKEVDEKMTQGYSYQYAIDENHKGIGEFYIVEADAKGRTRVLIYDIYQNGFMTQFDNDERLAYYFEDVTNKETWLYTDARWNEESAPQFAAEAEVSITKNTGGKFAVEFPQAVGKYGVYAYDLFLTDTTANITKSCRIYSHQWFAVKPENRSHEFTGLTSGNEYTLKIEPVNSFCKYGEPLTITFTAA